MIQHKIYLSSEAYVKDEKYIWFSNITFNGLFRLNLCTKQVEFIDIFRESAIEKEELHAAAYKEEGELIFVPAKDNKIMVYNIRTQRQTVINIPEVHNKKGFLANAYREENVIYLFPTASSDDVWCFDIKSKNIIKDVKLSKIWHTFAREENLDVRIYKNQTNIIMCCTETKCVCEINMKTKEAECFTIDVPEDGRFSRVAHIGDSYWILLEDTHDIYQWHRKQNIFTKYIAMEREWDTINHILPYSNILFLENEILLVNYYARNVMRVNIEKKVIEKAIDYPEQFFASGEMKWGAMFSDAQINNGREVWLFPRRGNMIIKYDLKTQNVEGMELVIQEQKIPYVENLVEKKSCYYKLLFETQTVCSLPRYLNQVHKFSINNGNKQNIGAIIFANQKIAESLDDIVKND